MIFNRGYGLYRATDTYLTSTTFWVLMQQLFITVAYYRIAGNFCGVFISAILAFLSATAELKTAEYFPLLFYLWSSIHRRRHDLGQYFICITFIII